MGAALTAMRALFPCMSGGSDGDTSTITVRSTSACCRGKIVQVRLDDEHMREISVLLSRLIEQNTIKAEGQKIDQQTTV